MNTDKDFSEQEPQDELQSLIARFLDADQRGAAVDREAILAEHPNLAEALRESASIAERLIQVLERDPVPLWQLTPDVPRDLETVCLKCLRKEPRKRYESAKDLGAELQRSLNGEPIHARPVGQTVRAWRWYRRNHLSTAFAFVTHHQRCRGPWSDSIVRQNRSRLPPPNRGGAARS